MAKKEAMVAPVSVIIPCYNCSATIKRAVISVASQTWRPAEVIMVDDKSQDETCIALDAIASSFEDGWIRILRHGENKGPGDARNTGWDAATQPYIAFLDADDTWHPRKVEIQLDYMQNNQDMAITGHKRSWLKKQGEEIKDLPLPGHYKIYSLSKRKMLVSNVIPSTSVMIRRDRPFRFEPAKMFSEDYLLWLSILLSGYKGAYIDMDLAFSYKAPYGAGGLSSQLWAMEKGEIDAYFKLWQKKQISLIQFLCLVPFSIVKYMRRVIISWLAK